MSKSKRICLAWHNFNSPNYGVSALAIAHFTMIAEAARKNGVTIRVDTLGTPNYGNLDIKEEVEKRFGINIDHINLSFRDLVKSLVRFDFSLFRIFREYDMVFDIGEGDSFSDIYGQKRFLLLCLTKWLSLVRQKKLVIAPQTVGPFQSKISSGLAKYLLGRSGYVYVRDIKSSNYLAALNVRHSVVSDVAFSLPFDRCEKIKDTVGLNVSALLWAGGYSGSNQFNLSIDYRSAISSLIEQFLLRGKTVHLIAHVIDDKVKVEDDYGLCACLKESYKGEDRVVLAPKFPSPIAAKSYISQMEFFTGARMHATIAAISCGVATVPVAYSRKFSGVFGSLGYNYTINAYGGITTEDFVSKLLDYYDNNRLAMCSAANSASESALNANNEYRDFLVDVIK